MSAPTPSGKTTAVVLAPALRTWRSLLTSPFPPAAFGSEGHTVSPWNSENPTGMMPRAREVPEPANVASVSSISFRSPRPFGIEGLDVQVAFEAQYPNFAPTSAFRTIVKRLFQLKLECEPCNFDPSKESSPHTKQPASRKTEQFSAAAAAAA
eukprot:CAMPEP_0206587444 /NCGR_PEP_ID=MMETSP0325_2-20121206/37656_1 /ASSEMBLY_ACC=CAM_ASM_000347 /TAXON_ID=2866 /ORGANISM="Crypthecodinium cohnii, Strain Seligo" /LENGTH=152 /DNA_ID=CAMNT_0054095463 /DNA_START=395 /DNA_END=848 /DNA_ORIENTATION=+